jgi:hypothetical protein
LITAGKFSLEENVLNTISVAGDNKKVFLDFFRGKCILFYMILKSNESRLTVYARRFSWVFGFVRGYIPSCFFLGKIQFFPGDEYYQKIVYLIMNYSLIIFFSYLMRFIIQSFIDFNRKIYLMNSLENLICTERIDDDPKILPTLNLMDITTVHSWNKMR